MVEVVGKKESIAQEATCLNCGSMLKYMPYEVQRGSSMSYGDTTPEYYNYIACPVCLKQVTAEEVEL